MTSAQIAPEIPVGTWIVEAAHSSATFEVEHAGVSIFRGGFKPVHATLVSADDDLRLEGAVTVASISVDDENIRPHLLSPDFFDAERNPEVRFRSTRISGDADDLRVEGELSMAGLAVPVAATGRVRGPISLGEHDQKVGLSLATTIDRTAFGMTWQMDLPGGEPALANDVRVLVELEFVKD